ncbi:hypothetical protein K438DRAFT_1761739 [Mycena galopus ATCC 62051]|nr:hypothetical protein K438DRAFT_1761739 [Mycena galopus ATCC 62051]
MLRATRSNAPRPPQDTSPASPALSELPPENPKASRALLEEIQAHFSSAQALNKKPSQALYKDIFTLLDTLRTTLDDKEVLTSSLNVFKSKLLAEIHSSAHPPMTTPAAPAPPTAKTNEFVVTLDMKSELLALSGAAILEKVVAALAASGVPRLQDVELKHIKVLPRGRLLVATHNEKSVIA